MAERVVAAVNHYGDVYAITDTGDIWQFDVSSVQWRFWVSGPTRDLGGPLVMATAALWQDRILCISADGDVWELTLGPFRMDAVWRFLAHGPLNDPRYPEPSAHS